MRYPQIFTKDSASVTLYRTVKADGYKSYCLCWYEHNKRERRTFTNREEATREADKLLDHILAGNPELATLSVEDAKQYTASLALIEKTGLSVVAVCREFMRTWRPEFQKATVRTVIKKWLDASRAYSQKYQKDLKYRLPAFQKNFGHKWIDEVGAEEVREWIEARTFNGEPVSSRTKTNWLRMLQAMWSFARDSNNLPKDRRHNLQEIKVWRHDPASYSCMCHGDLLVLLDLCDQHKGRDQLLPFLYLQAFAGLRTEEAKRLTYEDLVIRNGQIVAININADKAKTRTRRSIEVMPVFASYMHEFAVLWKRTGKIAKWSKIDLILHRIAKNNDVACLSWKHNQLRHTFATHLLRLWSDSARVAEYLGTSPAMLNSHYRELLPPDETESWMNMRQDSPRMPPPPEPNEPPF